MTDGPVETPPTTQSEGQGGNSNHWFQAVLAAMVCLGFFGALAALLYISIPSDSKEAVMLVIGALIASFSTVVGFYFGSSSSSKSKDKTIQTLSQ